MFHLKPVLLLEATLLVFHLMLSAVLFLFLCLLHGKTDAVALFIDAQYDNLYYIADFYRFTGMTESAVGYLRNVDQAVLARSDFDECAELHQADNAAVVQLANSGNENDLVDGLLGGVGSGGKRRCGTDESCQRGL